MTVIASKKSPGVFTDYLKNTLLLPDNPDLDSRIAFHTDLSLFSFGDTVICAPFLSDLLSRELPAVSVISSERPFSPYPHDVAYNAALVGKTLFCNVRYTSKMLLAEAQKRGFTLADVKQGYSKCSVIPVTDDSLITSDKSIAIAAEKEGKDVLFVSNQGVFLEGFDNGFIGGAALSLKNEIVFTGDISALRDAEKIVEFIEAYGKKAVYFKNFTLTDIGSPALTY
jgi:hypothetical protein